MRSEPVVLAQITDMHVSVGDHGPGSAYWVENNRRLRTALRSLNTESERPSVVIGTGDLVECGQGPAYDMLMEILSDLEIPFWPIPGNHDSRTRLRAAFPHLPWQEDHASWTQVVPNSDVTVIGLDSTRSGQSGGYVDEQRLEWLADAINSAVGPTIVAMHHPPFLTGIDWMDAMGFDGFDQVRKVLTLNPPTRIISGHYHRSVVSHVGSTPASVGIATTLHVNLDLSNASVPAVINDPIGYELHCVLAGEEHNVITHTRYIDRATVAQPIQLNV